MDPFAANQSPVASDTMLIEEYPEPVARAWQRVLIASPLPSFHHRQLLVAAETLAPGRIIAAAKTPVTA